jgi:hypothetical protein
MGIDVFSSVEKTFTWPRHGLSSRMREKASYVKYKGKQFGENQ